MDDTYEILAKGGIRWDTVAQQAYGNPNLFEDIQRANPELAQYDIIPDGMVIKVPVKKDDETATDDSLLPPWKRD